MKVILYMAMSVNGYIAKENNESAWSEEEWLSYSATVKKVKNLIIGKNTYEIMKKQDEFDKIGNPFIVVVSRGMKSSGSRNIVFVKSPKEALRILKQKGFDKALVGGGSKLNSSFVEENLVDEIILDVEPLIFGKGINLFEGDFEKRLELVHFKRLSRNTIKLHYKIKK